MSFSEGMLLNCLAHIRHLVVQKALKDLRVPLSSLELQHKEDIHDTGTQESSQTESSKTSHHSSSMLGRAIQWVKEEVNAVCNSQKLFTKYDKLYTIYNMTDITNLLVDFKMWWNSTFVVPVAHICKR